MQLVTAAVLNFTCAAHAGDDMVVLCMLDNPLNTYEICDLHLRRRWFANLETDDEFVKFT